MFTHSYSHRFERTTSGVTTAPATPAVQGAAPEGGGMLPNLLFFKREIVRLGSKMDHMSVNLAIGRREKNIWGYKKLQERQKAYNKNRKKSGDLFFYVFFFFFFGDSKNFVGAAKKISRRRQMVTLRHCVQPHLNSYRDIYYSPPWRFDRI